MYKEALTRRREEGKVERRRSEQIVEMQRIPRYQRRLIFLNQMHSNSQVAHSQPLRELRKIVERKN